MKYSTKFWLFVLLIALVKLLIYIFSGEPTDFKILIFIFLIVLYIFFCAIEADNRNKYDEDSDSKYLNIFWYPVRGIVLLNKFLDKLQEYDERDKQK